MLERAKAPSFSQQFTFQLPQPEIISFGDNARLIWLKEIQQEVFKIELIIDSGKWNEPSRGLSHFIALLLDKGTSKHSAHEISDILDYHGAQLEVSPGYDHTSVSLYGLKKSLREVLPLVVELITQADFPRQELKLQKDIFTQNLRVNNKKTSFIASKLLRQSLFGKNHPYGNSIEESDLEQISSENLTQFYKASFNLREVFMVGSFTDQDFSWIKSQLESAHTRKTNSVSPVLLEAGSDVRLNELKGVQATIRLGKRFINRSHADYASCLIANHILGGFFGSRLMKNIREEKGLTYGIYSSIQPLKNDCLLTIGADVNVDKVEIALSEIRNEINRLINDSLSDEELAIAKNHFLGSLQLEVSNPFAAIEKLKTIFLNDLNSSFYETLFTSIKDFSANHIRVATSKYLAPDSFTTVVVS